MKSTSTTFEPTCTGSLIWPFETTTFPSKPNKDESYTIKSSGFKFSPLYKSGYMVPTFSHHTPYLKGDHRASSCGCMVPTLSSSEKFNASWISILTLVGSKLGFLTGGRATDITLEGWESVLPRAAKMTLIVSKGGLEEASLRGP